MLPEKALGWGMAVSPGMVGATSTGQAGFT